MCIESNTETLSSSVRSEICVISLLTELLFCAKPAALRKEPMDQDRGEVGSLAFDQTERRSKR